MDKARWKRLVGVPVLAALFSVGTAYAQSLAKADQKALTDMAVANMAEVEMGKLALQKSQNAEVKSFARQMVDDHGKGLDEVKKVAQAKNVSLPSDLDSKHKALLSKLQGMSGDQFDRAYMEQGGSKAHSEALALVNKTKSGAKDGEVQALAAKLQPTIQQHKGHADQLNASIKGGSAMGNSGTQGASGSSGALKDRQPQPASGNTDSPASPANPTTQPPAPVK